MAKQQTLNVRNFEVRRKSMWANEYELFEDNQKVGSLIPENMWQTSFALMTGEVKYILKSNGIEVSVFEDLSGEEIAFCEGKWSGKYELRLRYHSDRVLTFATKWSWTTMSFEWQNEDQIGIITYDSQKWYSSDMNVQVNTVLTEGLDIEWLILVGLKMIMMYKGAQAT